MTRGRRQKMLGSLAVRLSPERTRRPTFLERHTVRRLSWGQIVWLNGFLELAGKSATALWIASIAALIVGIDFQPVFDDALNSGRPLRGVLAFVIVVPTAIFLGTRSLIGFGRWRLQRELWRRDVERLAP